MVALPLPDLPEELSALRVLALDLRWTWSHEHDAFWERIDARQWRSHAQSLERAARRVGATAAAPGRGCGLPPAARRPRGGAARLHGPARLVRHQHGRPALGGVAYLSMEFGLGAALPLYAGGLGVLAGDYLKTASDLDVPVVGVGLLYQGGLFPPDHRRRRRQQGALPQQRGMLHFTYPSSTSGFGAWLTRSSAPPFPERRRGLRLRRKHLWPKGLGVCPHCQNADAARIGRLNGKTSAARPAQMLRLPQALHGAYRLDL